MLNFEIICVELNETWVYFRVIYVT